jgi:uncharacterized protein (DUF4415 family)
VSAHSMTKREREPVRGRANLARLRRPTSDAAIERTSPPELAGLPDDFWDDAVVVDPAGKQPISLRLDEDVLTWFRQRGPGYQTRINQVLRSYMTHAAQPADVVENRKAASVDRDRSTAGTRKRVSRSASPRPAARRR